MRLAPRDRQINFHPMNFVADASRITSCRGSCINSTAMEVTRGRRTAELVLAIVSLRFPLAHAVLNYRPRREGSASFFEQPSRTRRLYRSAGNQKILPFEFKLILICLF